MPLLVSLIGGSGFIGAAVAEKLARRGARLRIAARRRARALRLLPLADPGQLDIVPADLRVPDSLTRAVAGADAVVNLAGTLTPEGSASFEAIHVRGAGAVAEAAARAGVRALAHVSAIGADPHSPSAYGRSKAEGERRTREAFPTATILRPSLVFGEDDGFTNRFARLVITLPIVPVVAPRTRFQPVFVGDVAEAIVRAIDRQLKGEAAPVFELGGPEVLTMRQIFEFLVRETGRRKPLVDVPDRLVELLARLPGGSLTRDQWLMLQRDNVVDPASPGLEALGITPTSLAAAAPQWLERYRPGGRFAALRTPA
ncbi:MAG: complex I NDUFA9 subunit family protein [Sphingomonadaceae bacterium]|nr:complex I NDUFA9 subunit family protein [Sphingomonadaceae bacterium]